MDSKTFLIKIGERQFSIDDQFEEFKEVAAGSSDPVHNIPMGQFRYNDGNWFILWDKEFNSCYKPVSSMARMPLTVQWVQVEFLSQPDSEKDYLDLMILLSETLWLLQCRCGKERFTKGDAAFKKFISQFNKS